ncbi:MAG TPA: M23 family metallopeptidase [Kofleriaceae bacterium]|nr:M23 family metallopeptidase [Kofleriaceae bacterium]
MRSMSVTHVLFSLVAASALAACATDDLDDVAGDELEATYADPGPVADEVVSDLDDRELAIPDDDTIAITVPAFQLPFPCGQVWSGSTRRDHSPPLAVDFNRANDFGDTVVAAAGGTVVRVENLGSVSYGRWIEIAHGNGYRTRYAHLSRQTVSVGQSVRRGQKIGEVGSTGGSTGPHLHYEERKDGVAIRAVFNGNTALYFGTKNYTSHNCR